jgi:branched-chain amino acid transport system permease protein
VTSLSEGLAADRAVRRRERLHPLELLPWLLLAIAYWALPAFLPLVTQMVVLAILALSLDLVLGYAGIITLGHAVFFGVGAYAAGMASSLGGLREPLAGLAVGAGAGAAAGLLSGLLLLRYRGLPMLILTMATSAVLLEYGNYRTDLTGGLDGLTGIEFAPLFGRFEFGFDGKVQYVYACAVAFACFLAARVLVNAPFGRSVVGIRENRLRMIAVGAPVFGRLVVLYVIAAALAGLAGALFAETTAFVTLEVLSFEKSGAVLVMVAIGGTGRLYGGLVGAMVYSILEYSLSRVSPEYWELGIGLVLIGLVLFARGGLLGWAARLRRAPC